MLYVQDIKDEIEKKSDLVKYLNGKVKELQKLEFKEKFDRCQIISDLEANATSRITDKTKQATADLELKDLIQEIEELKVQIGILRRYIELCNDKISCTKYLIRELELNLE